MDTTDEYSPVRPAAPRRAVGRRVGVAGLALVGAPVPLPVDAGLWAHVAGLLAGYLATVMLLLMSRTPVLERRVGSDVLARWHAHGGRAFIGLVLVHAGAAVQAWAAARQQDLVTSLLTVLGLPGLVEAGIGTVAFLAIAAMSVRAARRRVSYEAWHAVHLLTYGAVALSFGHELAGPNLAGRPVLQVLWTLMHAYPLALILRYRVLAPLATPGGTACASRPSSPRPTASPVSSCGAPTSTSSAPRPASSSAGGS